MDTRNYAQILAFANTRTMDRAIDGTAEPGEFADTFIACGHCIDAPEFLPMGSTKGGALYVPRS